MTVNGCPVQAPLGRGITWAEINGPPHALHALSPHMSVILSGVRRQPNVVERPRCCLDLTRNRIHFPHGSPRREFPVLPPNGIQWTSEPPDAHTIHTSHI